MKDETDQLLEYLREAVKERDTLEQEVSNMQQKLAQKESMVRTLTLQLLHRNKV